MTSPTIKNNISSIGNTIFDEDIARLEKRRAEVEAERQKLLNGQITVAGPDGSSLMEIDLGALSAASADQKTVERKLRQTLIENPLVPVLDNSFKKIRDLREEMSQRGELPAAFGSKTPLVKIIRANNQLNRVIADKNKTTSKVLASPWLLVVGFLILLLWCGGPLLYMLTGGVSGGKPFQAPAATPQPVLTVTAAPKSNPTTIPAAIQTPTPNSIGMLEKAAYLPNSGQVQTLALPQLQTQDQPTPTPTPYTDSISRVGDAPSQAGGFNGPHGAFLAPSRMKIAALTLDTPVERALTRSSNNEAAIVSWPRPGEVVHTGAYPGEIGNMLIMGNQKDLGGLRRIQQNDEVVVYDRKGNAFIYRFVAFSADGQTEREVDPTSIGDAWVFGPAEEAVLTILVTYPQPLPAVDPNQTGNSSTNQAAVKDDYLTQKKLAYRAVLAIYAPAPTVSTGTPVVVPDSAWQTVAAPANTPTPASEPTVTPAPTITPSPGVEGTTTVPTNQELPTASPGSVIPRGLPDTGKGGSSEAKPQPVLTINPKVTRNLS